MPSPSPLRNHIDALQADGRYVFVKAEVQKGLGVTPLALENALRRLSRVRRVIRVRSGFYIILPLEYRSAGTLPPMWFIDDLMRFLGEPYYVGLLSAAELHGAAHQKPQEFQVITNRPQRPIQVGPLRIRFVTYSHVESVPTQSWKTPTGSMRVSTPEATAFDLVRYPAAVGGISSIATILTELAPVLDSRKLGSLARRYRRQSRALIQRLGFLLEKLQRRPLARALYAVLPRDSLSLTPLRAARSWKGVTQNRRWRVAVNAEVSPDL